MRTTHVQNVEVVTALVWLAFSHLRKYDASGDPIGSDISVAKLLAQKFDFTPHFVLVNLVEYDGRSSALEGSTFDLVRTTHRHLLEAELKACCSQVRLNFYWDINVHERKGSWSWSYVGGKRCGHYGYWSFTESSRKSGASVWFHTIAPFRSLLGDQEATHYSCFA